MARPSAGFIVDSAEPPVLRAWANKKGLEVKPLPFGDFWLVTDEHWISVQRKTTSDLMGSVSDGRLEKDLGTSLMDPAVDEVVLFIEGKFVVSKDHYIRAQGRKFNVSVETLVAGLFDLFRYGVLPLYSPSEDPLTSAEILYKMWEDLSDPDYITSLVARGFGGSRKGVWRGLSPAERSLIALKVGLGPKKAAKALGDLSFKEFLCLSEEELVQRPGIGKGTAQKILEIADGRVPQNKG